MTASNGDATVWCLVVMTGVRMELPGEHAELLLKETEEPWRELVIPVALAEGRAIAYAWRGIATPRPLSHELFCSVLDLYGVSVDAVRITERQGGRFLAELDTSGAGANHKVSCRPSDAVAIVLRQRLPTPILVASDVFEVPGVEGGPSAAMGGTGAAVVNPLEAAMDVVIEADMAADAPRRDPAQETTEETGASSA